MSIIETVLTALNGARLAARTLGHDAEGLEELNSAARPVKAELWRERAENAQAAQPLPQPANSDLDPPDNPGDGGFLDSIADAFDWLVNIF